MFNGVYSNATGVPQSLSGSKSYLADTVHFSSQDCNITCDGPALTVCCPVDFKQGLVIDELCIDGELGCDKLVVQTGATNGIAFSDDPCASPVVSVPAIYKDSTGLNVVATDGSISGRATAQTTFVGNEVYAYNNYASPYLVVATSPAANGGGSYWALSDPGQRITSPLVTGGSHTATYPNPPQNGLQFISCNFIPSSETGGQTTPTVIRGGWSCRSVVSGASSLSAGVALYTRYWTQTHYLEPTSFTQGGVGNVDGVDVTNVHEIGTTTNRIHRVSADRLNLKLFDGTSSGQPKSPIGEAGDKQGDIVFGGISGSTFNMFVCVADYDSTSNIWVMSSAFGAWSY
jgi:hypothetical protein